MAHAVIYNPWAVTCKKNHKTHKTSPWLSCEELSSLQAPSSPPQGQVLWISSSPQLKMGSWQQETGPHWPFGKEP